MSLLDELKRRNVIRVVGAYLVGAWFIAQIADVVLNNIGAPDWVIKALFLLLAIGLVFALLFSWAYEITPEGIKREQDVVRDASITHLTARRLDIITITLLIFAIGMVVMNRYSPKEGSSTIGSPIATEVAAPADRSDPIDIRNPAPEKSIAVLPFANLASAQEMEQNESFTVGIHDDLLTNLSKVGQLKVISRTSVLRYRGTEKKKGEIARELGVATILEGGVQRSGDNIRMNVSLVDPDTEKQLWTERFDRQTTAANIFQIQSEISEHIAVALKAELTPDETEKIKHAPTDSLVAYDAYLAGRRLMLDRTSKSLREAQRLFEYATNQDPDYALAYVGRADVIALRYYYDNISYEQMLEEGEPLARKALELDPGLAEAHTSVAGYLMEQNEFAKAEKSFKKALALNSNYATAYHWYGLLKGDDLGQYAEGLQLFRKAAALDPLSPVIQVNVGYFLEATGQFEEALAQYKRTYKMNPEYPGAAASIGGFYWRTGKLDQAIIWQRRVLPLDPASIYERAQLARMYIDIDDIEMARQELDVAITEAPQHSATQAVENLLAMRNGDYSQALAKIEDNLAAQPDDINLKREAAFFRMLNEQYDAAIEIWYELYTEPDDTAFELNPNTLEIAVNLAWALKQVGRSDKSNDLIDRALSMSESMNVPGFGGVWFRRAGLFAVKGDTAAAAAAYAEAVAAGVRVEWWTVDHLPYFTPVRDEPVFKAAYQRLRDDIAAQRDRLHQHDSLTELR